MNIELLTPYSDLHLPLKGRKFLLDNYTELKNEVIKDNLIPTSIVEIF